MKSQGVGATEIAQALGIGRATVYRVLEPGR
jgi:DNA invertase Pin-like site-specific DNA recombinase